MLKTTISVEQSLAIVTHFRLGLTQFLPGGGGTVVSKIKKTFSRKIRHVAIPIGFYIKSMLIFDSVSMRGGVAKFFVLLK